MASSTQIPESALVKLTQVLERDFDFSRITKNNIDLTHLMPKPNMHSIAFSLEHVFTPAECEGLIKITNKVGYTIVPVNFGGIEEVNEDKRSGFRTMVDDEEFAEKLWERVAPHVPQKVMGAEVVGLNERFRFLKYNSKHFFAPHWDGCYSRPHNKLEKSLVTIQMYLNEDVYGGETTFLKPGSKSKASGSKERMPVKPKTGMVLVFTQDLLHEGSVVNNGDKYTVRTDIMYSYGQA